MPKNGQLVPDDDPSAIGAPHDLTPAERQRFATEVLRGARTIRLALGMYLRGLGPQSRSIVGRWPSQMAELRELQQLSGVEGCKCSRFLCVFWRSSKKRLHRGARVLVATSRDPKRRVPSEQLSAARAQRARCACGPQGWKSTRSYYTGSLAGFNASFLESFCRGVAADVQYLRSEGLRVTWWGLQNEPTVFGGQPVDFWGNDTKRCPPAEVVHAQYLSRQSRQHGNGHERANSYSMCGYTQCEYYHAFKACAPKVRALDPNLRVHANSWSGQVSGAPIALDSDGGLPLVDAFTWHTVNAPSASTFGNHTRLWAYGKADFTNEMEYQPGSPFAGTAVGTAAAVNTFLNTLTFKDSPTGVIVLHAIKPTTNAESLGYGWSWWRSSGTPPSPQFPGLQPNHFTLNYWNWNSVAPFIKNVPWNSPRRHVVEDVQRVHQRVVAFETPAASVERGPLLAHTAPVKANARM